MNVTILGAGAFGTALGKVLVDNGHEVRYFDVKDASLTLEESLAEAEAVVVVVVPSGVVAEVVGSLPERVRGLPVILASKGLLSLGLFAEFGRFSMLSGPTFAEDLVAGAASTLTATDEIARELFENEQVRIEVTGDALGVMLCGALKNVYAIGAGMLPDFDNTAAAYIERAHSEMRRYLGEHGADEETADLACGIGDLILTCGSEQSRNFRCGRMIAEGANLETVLGELGTVEGVIALRAVERGGYEVIGEIWGRVFAQGAKKHGGMETGEMGD